MSIKGWEEPVEWQAEAYRTGVAGMTTGREGGGR